jgi:dTDP-4-dehydrorhamnose reductase
MTMLVTGGGGYLGSELVRQALAAGEHVTATWLHREAPKGTPLRLDLADAASVDDAFARVAPRVVVHTAYRQADEHLERDVVAATTNVARAAAAVGARLVHVSSDLVFDGEREPPRRYAEDDEPRPVSAYGSAKLAAERVVLGRHPDALVVRTSLLYGNPGGPQERLAARDDVTFYTDEIRTPIHVADLAAALLELARRTETGLLHVAGPDALSRVDLARALAPGRTHRAAPSPPDAGRARNVALDSSRAAALVRAPVRSVGESLHSLHS